MTTEQLSMLTAMMQNAARPSFGAGSKDGKTDFQDMLEQKADRPAQTKDKPKAPAKEDSSNVQQEKPQVTEQNPSDGDGSENGTLIELMAAQQLAMALAAQQFAAPVAAFEQPAVETVAVVEIAAPVQQGVQSEMMAQTEQQVQMPEQQAEMPMIEEMAKPTQQKVAEQPLQQAEQKVDVEAEPEVRVQTETRQDSQELVKQDNTESKDVRVRTEVAQIDQPLFRELEATPIKVAENTHTVDAEAPDLDEQLANKVQATLKQVGDRVQIQLTPEHLGRITIELTQTVSGIGLVVHAENAKTTSLLTQHAGNLGALLENRTGEQVQVQVPQQENQQQNYDGHNRQQHDHQQNHAHNEQMDKDEQDSFLGQLRLGLYQMENV